MWRVEIDYDGGGKTLVPIISEDVYSARKCYDDFCDSLNIDGVIRLYAPGRLLTSYCRIERIYHDGACRLAY